MSATSPAPPGRAVGREPSFLSLPVDAIAELRVAATPSPVSRIVRDRQMRKAGGSGGLRPRRQLHAADSHSGAKAGD